MNWWFLADALRKRIEAMGYVLEDKEDGPRIHSLSDRCGFFDDDGDVGCKLKAEHEGPCSFEKAT